MRNATTPKLVVCNLDLNLLHDRDAEGALLDKWMTWQETCRPLLHFYSAQPVDEIQHLLPSSVLPPADFLVGGSTGMLVRHSFWNHEFASDQRRKNAGFAPEQLLASMASRALEQLTLPTDRVTQSLPVIKSAARTMAGLCVIFGSEVRKSKQPAAQAPLAWLIAQLQFDASEILTYAREERIKSPRSNASAR